MNTSPSPPGEHTDRSSLLDQSMEKARQLRRKLGPLWWYSLLVFATSRVTDALSLYFGTFFLPTVLTTNELGAVDPINRLIGLGAIPITVVGTVAAKYLSVYHAKGEDGKIKGFVCDMTWLAVSAAVLFVVVLAIFFAPLRLRLHVDSPHLFIAISGMAVLSCWQPLIRVALQGMQRFYAIMLLGPIDAAAKLAFSLILIPVYGVSGYLFALTITGMVTLTIGFSSLRPFLAKSISDTSYRKDMRGILAFAWPVAIWTTAGCLQGFIEPFVVKNFLPPEDAAGFYMVCRFGYIPTYLVGPISFVLFPLLSHQHERGEDTGRHLRQALGITAIACSAGAVLMGFSTHWILGLRDQWIPFQMYAHNVWSIGLIVTLDSLIAIYATHEVACRRFSFLLTLVPVVLIECGALYTFFGWAAFRELVPLPLWERVDTLFPRSLESITRSMLIARVAIVLGFATIWRFEIKRRTDSTEPIITSDRKGHP